MDGLMATAARVGAGEFIGVGALFDELAGGWKRCRHSRRSDNKQLILLVKAILEADNDLRRGLELGNGTALRRLEVGVCLFTVGLQFENTSLE